MADDGKDDTTATSVPQDYTNFPSRAPVIGPSVHEGKQKREIRETLWDYLSARRIRQAIRSTHCIRHVVQCMEENDMVKTLVGAMEASGCKVKLSRHVSCEPCNKTTYGGYDSVNKQLIICENVATKSHQVCNTLTHELLHAYDDCRAKLNLKNTDHLACTEIRAASLSTCSYMNSLVRGYANPFGKDGHKKCVKDKARLSIMAVKKYSKEEADEAIDRVFDRCYGDLEPIGRIPRSKKVDAHRVYVEASLYGYTEVSKF